jgi:hypothetical protein
MCLNGMCFAGAKHFEEDPKRNDPETGRPRHLEEVTRRIYVEPSMEQQKAAYAAANRAAKSIPADRPSRVLKMNTSHVDRVFWRVSRSGRKVPLLVPRSFPVLYQLESDDF